MRDHFTKSQRRRLRELRALAYERELAEVLAKVEADFRRWRGGEIHVHELNDRIHEFHDGASRDLWSMYTRGHLELAVLGAISRGILRHDEVGETLMEILRPRVELWEP